MSTYSKIVAGTGKGATSGTYDSVGDITLRSDARKTLGFWISAAAETMTAAEGVTGKVRISSSDLGIGQQVAMCPPYVGGSPATNIGFMPQASEFLPFLADAKGKEKVSVEYSINDPDPTAGCSVAIALVYDAGKTSALGSEALKQWPAMTPICKGFQTVSKAPITVAGETAMDPLTVPAWAKEIVGFKVAMMPDLMTAGEEVVGYCRFRSTLPDFEPQEWPFVAAMNAPLGTPVGAGAGLQAAPPMGCSFPLSGQSETITPYIVLNAAITTGHGAVATVYYR